MAKVVIKNSGGSIIAEFDGNTQDSLGMQANDAGSSIPLACGGNGVCGACACKVSKGSEFISSDKFGAVMTSVGDNEVLSCRAGILDGTPNEAEIELTVVNS